MSDDQYLGSQIGLRGFLDFEELPRERIDVKILSNDPNLKILARNSVFIFELVSQKSLDTPPV
jgi:hypothetical protein